MMRFARLSAAIAASLVFSGSALAATFSTPTFSVDGVHDTWTLISAENGIVKVAIPSVTPEVEAQATSDGWPRGGHYADIGTFTPAAGYRLATVTATGRLTGNRVGPADSGTNSASIWLMGFPEGGQGEFYQGGAGTTNLTGTVPFEAIMPVGSSQPLDFFFEVETYAHVYRDFPVPSYYSASMSVTDVVLTFQMVPVAAVPEPSAWVMLVGGLGVAGFAARRARKSAPAAA